MNSILNLDGFASALRNDIEFSVNGIPSINYSFKNNILYSSINLKPGANIIKVKGINEYGSGGMQTKIEAAKICQLAGSSMIIANGL